MTYRIWKGMNKSENVEILDTEENIWTWTELNVVFMDIILKKKIKDKSRER